MLSSSQTIAPRPATLPPAQPPVAGTGNNGGASFTQFLTGEVSAPAPAAPAPGPAPAAHAEQRQDRPGEPAPAPASTARPAEAKAAPAPAASKSSASAGRKAAEGSDAKAQQPVKPKAGADAGDAASALPPTDPASADDDATDDAPDAASLEELTQFLGLHAGTEARHATPAADGKADGRADAGSKSKGNSKLADLPVRNPARGVTNAPAAPDTSTASAKADALQAAESSVRGESLALSTASNGAAASAAAPRQVETPSSFAAMLAAQSQPASATPEAAGSVVPSAQVRAPLHSASFAPELGARVSLLAAGGVQQAELQLNPADMGPVSVQIVVDGAQAQVSFHAAQAETRHALQQSLPELAAALQGQGLTLSGGGVFQQTSQHAGSRSTDGDASRGTGLGTEGSTETTATAMPARRTVGLLDTFA